MRDIQIQDADKYVGKPLKVVAVFIDLPTDFTLHKNAVVQIKKDLTGSPAINIVDLGSSQTLAAGEWVIGKPDSLTAFENHLGDIDLTKVNPFLDEVTNTVQEVHGTVRDVHGDVPGVIEHYHRIADAAIKLLDDLHDMFGPSTGDYHTTMKNLAATTGTLKEKLPPLADQISALLKNIDNSVTKAGDALTSIQATAVNAKDITQSRRSVIVDNKSKLDSFIANLKTASENLKFATVEIRHSPWRLLYQPKEGEISNLNTYDSVRQFAQGAGAG